MTSRSCSSRCLVAIVAFTFAFVLMVPQFIAAQGLSDDERFTLLTAPADGLDLMASAELQHERFAALWGDDDYGAGLAVIDDADLMLRLRVAGEAMGRSGAPDWVVSRYLSVLSEASKRELAQTRHYQQLFDFHSLQIDFKRAAEVKRSFPHAELPEIPVLHRLETAPAAGERRVLRVGEAEVTEVSVNISPGNPGFVVEASTGCGFVRLATEALGRDPLLAPLVAEHGLWLADAQGVGSLQNLAVWNAQFPHTPIHLVTDRTEWPELEFDVTPRFVFFGESGETFDMLGWQGDSATLTEFAQGLVQIGVLEEEQISEDRFAYAEQPAARDSCATWAPALQAIHEQASVTSRQGLELHLQQAESSAESPLFLLTAPARERLVASMHFRDGSVPSFRIDDIVELLPEDRYAILSLFGAQYFFAGQLFPAEFLTDEERDLRDRVNCAGAYAEVLSSD